MEKICREECKREELFVDMKEIVREFRQASQQSSVPDAPATTPDRELLNLFIHVGEKLCPASASPLHAAASFICQCLHRQGIRSIDQLQAQLQRNASEGSSAGADWLNSWADFSSSLSMQPSMGSSLSRATSNSSISSPPSFPSPSFPTSSTHFPPAAIVTSIPSSLTSEWKLLAGVPLDVTPTEATLIRRMLLSHPSGFSGRVALILGDVQLPDTTGQYEMEHGARTSTQVIQAAMQTEERTHDAFLTTLLQKLKSLNVQVLICKGSFNKDILHYLHLHSLICLETIPMMQLDTVSQYLGLNPVSDLSQLTVDDVDSSHDSIILTVQEIGWDPSLVHKNVVREMEKQEKHPSLQSTTQWKLLLTRKIAAASNNNTSQTGFDSTPAYFCLFSSHATTMHSKLFAAVFKSLLSRFKCLLADGCLLRGGGAVEMKWARRLEEEAERIQQQIAVDVDVTTYASKKSPLSTMASQQLEFQSQRILVLQHFALAWRNWIQQLRLNADEHRPDDVWVSVHGLKQAHPPSSTTTTSIRTNGLYEAYSSKLSSLSTLIYLFRSLLQLDGAFFCANSKTIYQPLRGGRTTQFGGNQSIRVL